MTSPYIPIPAAPLPLSEDPSSMELSSSADDDEGHGRPRLGRSATINSLGDFEFEHALLPLTLSGDADVDSHKEERHVELWHGRSFLLKKPHDVH